MHLSARSGCHRALQKQRVAIVAPTCSLNITLEPPRSVDPLNQKPQVSTVIFAFTWLPDNSEAAKVCETGQNKFSRSVGDSNQCQLYIIVSRSLRSRSPDAQEIHISHAGNQEGWGLGAKAPLPMGPFPQWAMRQVLELYYRVPKTPPHPAAQGSVHS